DADPKKGVKAAKAMLEKEGLPLTDENIFIAASCKEKGILFLTGKSQVNGMYKINREEEAAKKKGEYTVTVNGKAYGVKIGKDNATVNGSSYPLNVAFGIDEKAIEATKAVASDAPAAAAAPTHDAVSVKAPMPGLILRIEVKEGQKVTKNQVVLIMEAMKMENEIFAPCDGVVTKISVSQGQQMQSDDELLVIA
ncbi:MAG: biotin attachment protein, partial [Spirochaetales bacterium]|nr:biotin attachment protein [Spirochaetales bacterium]